jgi:hypothetical protein
MNTPPDHRSPPRASLTPAAEAVAYAGILPLVLCPLAVAFLPGYEQRFLAQQVAVTYGAVVLAALGGIHWGFALAGRIVWRWTRAIGAMLPPAGGVAAVAIGGERGLALLVVALGLFWLYEHRGIGDELPQDYVQLRRNLTLAGCCLLAITMILSDTAGLS